MACECFPNIGSHILHRLAEHPYFHYYCQTNKIIIIYIPKNIENGTYYNQLIYHYDDWLKYTDAQFSKHLRSSIFLDSFQRYVDELIDANRYAKKIGYLPPLSLLDDYIDNLLKTVSYFLLNTM
jgi:hypothetical protein